MEAKPTNPKSIANDIKYSFEKKPTKGGIPAIENKFNARVTASIELDLEKFVNEVKKTNGFDLYCIDKYMAQILILITI